ncbi:SpoIIE family protein phosphatase [Streptomyces sp. NPDC087917]|uniref:SpoIIE family protein phosphatase n=1 Tax=Streptomyces sp. NPDC087917 TaxID=3155060 RepID=UPI00341B7666
MSPDRPGGEAFAGGPIRSEPGSLLEHVSVAVFGLDEAGRICFWGPGARELFGYEATEALFRPAALLFPEPPPGTAHSAARLAERARALGYWRVRLNARHRDGTVFGCGFRVFPVTGAGGTAPADLAAPAGPTPPAGITGADGSSVVMGLASRGDELDRVKTNLSFLDALFETSPIGLVMLDRQLRYVHLNQVLADMDGLPVREHLGRPTSEIMLTSDGGEFQRMLRAVSDEGRPLVSALVGMRTPGRPDRDQVRSVSFFPLTGAGDTRPGIGGLLVDVTDREHALLEATAARQRLALLDRAAARVGTTLDVPTTARELVGVAVPGFCDGAVVELVEWMNPAEAFDPLLPLITRRIAARSTLRPFGPVPTAPDPTEGRERTTYPPGSALHRMLSTRRPLHVTPDEEAGPPRGGGPEREGESMLPGSGFAHLLLAPLIARGAVQGVAAFGRSRARPAFTGPDLSLAGELASRAALCLDNARLFSRAQDIALTLQRALLPGALASGPYVELAHRYLPASRATEVGGDWYDVIDLPGGRIALLVGDVMGHGVPAAASMGRLRITARALARHTRDPGELLAELDACAQESGIEFATCLCLFYDPRTGRARLANAGHPPPLLRRLDGAVETLGGALGVPLGVGGVALPSTEIDLPDGAVLALYTDGLIETRTRDIEAGLHALRERLAAQSGSLEESADRILSALLPAAATDDTVLLLARIRHAATGAPPRM